MGSVFLIFVKAGRDLTQGKAKPLLLSIFRLPRPGQIRAHFFAVADMPPNYQHIHRYPELSGNDFQPSQERQVYLERHLLAWFFHSICRSLKTAKATKRIIAQQNVPRHKATVQLFGPSLTALQTSVLAQS